jgi:Putative abortive phage resistance protein AbiGi, antitoxin
VSIREGSDLEMDREINDILYFRTDISPFLVHLARDVQNGLTAGEALEQIIQQGKLFAGESPVSDARFGKNTSGMTTKEKKHYFGAICFTETPLNEVHCLLEIADRKVKLAPYGIVFSKENLRRKGVSPVFYINNELEDKDSVFQALCSLITTYPDEAAKILPLIAVFGKQILAPGAKHRGSKEVNFLWEREWRFPLKRIFL